jgi:hypothetical protein
MVQELAGIISTMNMRDSMAAVLYVKDLGFIGSRGRE